MYSSYSGDIFETNEGVTYSKFPLTIAPSLPKAEKDITTINKDNITNRFIENCF